MKEKNAPIGRIAIIYPWSNIDTLPSLRDSIVLLVEHGYQVDLFTLHDLAFPLPSFSNGSVSVFTTPEVFADAGIVTPSWTYGRGGRPYGWLVSNMYRPLWRNLYFKRMITKRHSVLPYVFIIGMDPEGLLDAAPLAEWLRVPLLYWSLEILFSDEINSKPLEVLKTKEIEYSRRAAFSITQDEWRASALIHENGIMSDRVLKVPNAPLGQAFRRPHHYLRERFGIPLHARIILCAGTLASWTMSQELIEAARALGPKSVLVMHSLKAEGNDLYVHRLVESADASRVFFSFDPMQSNEFAKLVNSADIGVALYRTMANRYLQKNLQTMGYSSGKLSTYLQCGLPIIVNNFIGPSNLVETYQCGVCIEHPDGMGEACIQIMDRYEFYSTNARHCFNEQLELEAHFVHVVERLDQILRNG